MTEDANAFLDQAFAEHAAGRADAAKRRCRQALALNPALAVGHYLLGTLTAPTAAAAAVRPLRRGLWLTPAAAAIQAQLALALLQAEQSAEAGGAARQTLAIAPENPDANEVLGLLDYRRANYGGAVRFLLRAHRLRPEKTETLINLGAALRDARLFDAAETVYGAAIKRRPELEETWLGRAATRLVRGDLTGGWEDLEHRWKRFSQPSWDGRPLNGETLLLHAEQGFGDTIQFARYVPPAVDRGARVVLETHPALVRLMRRLDPRITVVPSDAPPPPFDLHCPLMSLPRIFAATLDNIPAPAAYLTPPPVDFAAAAARVRAAGRSLHVGLCWAGNPAHKNDHNRSLPPALLADMLTVPGATFWSLQTGAAERAMPSSLRAALSPPPLALDDFAATAAVIAALDLVVTVDTVIAHLAGALGVACRVLLPYAPDWRWLTDRNDTPWYPSLRLIRQTRPGDWSGVVTQTRALLRGVAQVETEQPAARRANPAS